MSDRRRVRRAPTALRRSVPIRTYADWNAPDPGFMEIDLVAHCGDAMAGAFVHTLTLTDIASTWDRVCPTPGPRRFTGDRDDRPASQWPAILAARS
jgi:hypothetical protein